MKKSDLKTGDLVVTASGKTVCVYLGTANGDIVAGKQTWFPLKDYKDEKLFEQDGFEDFRHDYEGDCIFVQVWRPKANCHFAEETPRIDYHTLIWEFKKKSESQLQLEQVMSKLSELQQEAQRLQEIVAKENK